MDINFTFTIDYKNEFKQYVDSFYTKTIEGFDERSTLISNLTDAYISASGERPEVTQLDRLSTWLIRGFEKDDSEALVLTNRQMRRRSEEKEIPFHTPENRYFHLETDGNRLKKNAPTMDSTQSHKTKVKLINDDADLRQFNGPLVKYFIDIASKT